LKGLKIGRNGKNGGSDKKGTMHDLFATKQSQVSSFFSFESQMRFGCYV